YHQSLDSIGGYSSYFLCQEAVWEAFRIFFDRIPGTAEYQRWVHTCQHESLCISDIAKNFSSAEEHVSMIHKVRQVQRTRQQSALSQQTHTAIRHIIVPFTLYALIYPVTPHRLPIKCLCWCEFTDCLISTQSGCSVTIHTIFKVFCMYSMCVD
uniref:Uncharacterized protein n=1 Tax=Amphiprion percula TaxID=161767 RepID=A0A3P8RME1_AMPPE